MIFIRWDPSVSWTNNFSGLPTPPPAPPVKDSELASTKTRNPGKRLACRCGQNTVALGDSSGNSGQSGIGWLQFDSYFVVGFRVGSQCLSLSLFSLHVLWHAGSYRRSSGQVWGLPGLRFVSIHCYHITCPTTGFVKGCWCSANTVQTIRASKSQERERAKSATCLLMCFFRDSAFPSQSCC